jgi:hypothetical protein
MFTYNSIIFFNKSVDFPFVLTVHLKLRKYYAVYMYICFHQAG